MIGIEVQNMNCIGFGVRVFEEMKTEETKRGFWGFLFMRSRISAEDRTHRRDRVTLRVGNCLWSSLCKGNRLVQTPNKNITPVQFGIVQSVRQMKYNDQDRPEIA